MAIVRHYDNQKMTSLYIKSILMSYWRFTRQKVAIDEFRSMDIAVIDRKDLIDCEVKISKADLLNDNKKEKHIKYSLWWKWESSVKVS